jgi:hypothetical protein
MAEDYSELLNRLDDIVSGKTTNFTNKTNEQAATAIRALVDDNWRLWEALGVLTACASSDDAFGLDNALSNARAALGETR